MRANKFVFYVDSDLDFQDFWCYPPSYLLSPESIDDVSPESLFFPTAPTMPA